MRDRTTDIGVKIERAKEHVRNLAAEITAFLEAGAYEITAKDNPETGQKDYGVDLIGELPSRWSAIIGDAVHNCRATLDMLIYQLVRANGQTPKEGTRFPIHRNAKEFEGGRRPAEIKGISDAAVDLITAIKPYKGSTHHLWSLHQMDICDKHYLLLPVAIAFRQVTFNPQPGNWMVLDFTRAIRPDSPLKHGAILGSSPRNMNVDPKITVDIAFLDAEGVEGYAVIPTLNYFAQLVEAVVQPFRPLLT